MNTILLKYAVEIERAGSITQAADNLYMGQPNLSKALKELEDTLGIQIFERTAKGVVATAKGREFLQYAKNVLSQVDAMERLSVESNSDRQLFSISIPRTCYIAKAVSKFIASLEKDSSIQFSIEETNSLQAIYRVAEGFSNLGIIRYQTNYEKYFYDFLEEKKILHTAIWEFNCLAVMSRQHPLAGFPKIKPEDLQQYPEIAFGDTRIPYIGQGETGKNPEAAKKSICVFERCTQFEFLSCIPTAYCWGSPIPEDWAARYGVTQRRCDGANRKMKDVLIYPQDFSFTALDRLFMDQLYQVKNEVSLKKYL